MPIVDGRYEARISTTFATAEEGIKAVKEKLAAARKVRISTVPMCVLDELKPMLAGKDVMMVLPAG